MAAILRAVVEVENDRAHNFLFVPERKQGRVVAHSGGIDGERALDRKAVQIVGPTGLGTSTRKALAAKGLHTHDRTDHIAVKAGVAQAHVRLYVCHHGVNTRANAERGITGNYPASLSGSTVSHPCIQGW